MKPLIQANNVVVRVVERFRPYSGESIGYYYQVAVRNKAGFAFGREVMVFGKPYRVYPDQLVTCNEDIQRIEAILRKRHTLEPL